MVEPHPEEFIPVGCSTVIDFKVEKPSSVPDRFVARMPEPIPELKQWVEGQREEKKRGSEFPCLGKEKTDEEISQAQGGSGIMPPYSIRRLRDEPEEGEEELAYVRANIVIQQSSESAEVDKGALAIIPEQGKAEAIPSRPEMVEGETWGMTSRAAEDILRDELGIIDITGSPQILDAMIREANMLESRSYEGASVLHNEAFLQIREEHEAEVWNLTEKSDTYKLLSEKLRVDLATAWDEHAEIVEQVDVIQAETEEFKKIMDILASKKEIVQAQLESAETQLQAAKEKASVHIKELQHRLDLAISDKASLASELEVARSEMTETNKRADAKVAQFRVDVEVNQAKGMVEHAKWQARREALEGVSAQGFNIVAEIENAKAEEARARRLAFPEEDSESSSSEYEDRENPEDGDATSNEYQAT
ncbi:uncharacterized protein [Nicotiana tomentosiformis]|uniref:uncharacterized protein n=1 Tax=Nicotiana tomentosiformis TaxID=4098 RepID=UPI00388C6138